MVFLESCKTGLILLVLLVVWYGITCGLSNKFQRHMEFYSCIWVLNNGGVFV